MNQTCLQAIGLRCDYQPETDLLYAWYGTPQVAENIEVEPGVYVRVEPSSKQVIGIEVIDCAERFQLDPATIDATVAKNLIDVFSRPALERLAAARPPSLFSSPR